MSPVHIFKRLKDQVKQYGLSSSLVFVFDSIINRFVPFTILYVVLLERNRVKKPPTAGETKFTCRLTTIDSFKNMLGNLDPQLVEKHALDSYVQDAQEGDLLLLNYAGDELAGFTCAHLGGTPYLLPDLRLRVPDSVVYNFSAFTFPKFRGKHLQGLRHYELLHQKPCRGKAGLIGYVHYNNFESLRGVVKSGYRILGKIWVIGRGEHKKIRLSKSVRRFGIELM